MKKLVVFTSLAFNQTRFFTGLAKRLESNGIKSIIIAFHEQNYEFIQSNGIDSFSVFDVKSPAEDIGVYLKRYNVQNFNALISHEKLAYGLPNSSVRMKYQTYFHALEWIFDKIFEKYSSNSIDLIQEAGGFASLIAAHYIAQSKGCDSYFLEPSIFKGRFFYVKNQLGAPKIRLDGSKVTDKSQHDYKAYKQELLAKQSIVIPDKDKEHYRSPLRKVFNSYNAKRLVQKAYEKYVLRQNEEFSYLKKHVAIHLEMLANERSIRSQYCDLPNAEKLIYFPFHVPGDVALTLRAPEYLDQLALVDYIARMLPVGYKLLIKEHPARVGSMQAKAIGKLLRDNDNIVLLKPSVNTFDVLKKVELVITINSKTGGEALLASKKVLVLGDAFYRDSEIAVYEPVLSKLGRTIEELLQSEHPTEKEIDRYFQIAWEQSFPGEIHLDDENNFGKFSESVFEIL